MDNKLEIKELKIKAVEYYDKNIYVLNTIDDDILNETSEFPIGSITKIFTAISILLLHEHKIINIYENISKYLSEFISENDINHLKIIDIMNHTSGLKDFHDYIKNDINCKCYNEETKIFNCACGEANQKVF